jgi:plastocyanin
VSEREPHREPNRGRIRRTSGRRGGARGWFVAALAVSALLLAAAPAGARSARARPAAENATSTQDASITDSGFDPTNVEISAGTAVVWTNNGSRAHDVTSSTGLFQSGLISPGQQFTYLFDTAGTYPYTSASDAGVSAKVTVTGVGATALTDPTAPTALGAPTTPATATGNPDAFAYTGAAESIGLALLGAAALLFGWALVMGNGSALGALEPWRVLAFVDPRRAGFNDELLPRGLWRRNPRHSTQANLLPAGTAHRPPAKRGAARRGPPNGARGRRRASSPRRA